MGQDISCTFDEIEDYDPERHAEAEPGIGMFVREDDYQYTLGLRCRSRYREIVKQNARSPVFPRETVLVESVLGEGAFATVLLCHRRDDPRRFAVRRLDKVCDREDAVRAIREKYIVRTVDYPFITKFYGTFQDDAYVYFVMEWIEAGTLEQFVSRILVDAELASFWVAQLVLAVDYLHTANIVHRDIKLANILVTADGYIKLADFDAAKSLDGCGGGKTSTFVGSPYYLPPEIALGVPYGKEADWWTVGIVTHVLLYRQSPMRLNYRYGSFEVKHIIGPGFSKTKFGSTSDEAKDFMHWTLRSDPDFRLGDRCDGRRRSAKQHEFFAAIDFRALYLKQVPFPNEDLLSRLLPHCPPLHYPVPFKFAPDTPVGNLYNDF